jgi:glycosyltransferase involved in cell wall biosynthesis
MPDEIIIVDDASRDETPAIARQWRGRFPSVHILRDSERMGVSATLNCGFARARGSHVLRLAHDDALQPRAVETFARLASQTPEAIVYSDMHYMDEKGVNSGLFRAPTTAAALRDGSGLGLSFLLPRSVWFELGGFDSEFDFAEDFEFLSRAEPTVPFVHHAESLMRHRIHSGMASQIYAAEQSLAYAKCCSRLPSTPSLRSRIADAYRDAGWQMRQRRQFVKAMNCYLGAGWQRQDARR